MKLLVLLLMGVLNSTMVVAQSGADINGSPDALSSLLAAREQAALPANVTQAPKPTSFFDTHVLVFFFASTCPHCHEQAPVLASWAHEFGARVDARSFDDKPLPGFESQQPVTKDLVDAAFAGNPIRYPALFVMNEATGVLYPAAIGALNAIELQARMSVLIPKIIHFEQGVQA